MQAAFLHAQLETIGPWPVTVLEFLAPTRKLALPVIGLIGNSVPTSETGKARTVAWKMLVASEVLKARGGPAWSPDDRFLITLAFAFHPGSHGHAKQRLDVENFVKPTLDALAAGLFADPGISFAQLSRWDYDDSNFRHLFIHRGPDVRLASNEGVTIYVSAQAAY